MREKANIIPGAIGTTNTDGNTNTDTNGGEGDHSPIFADNDSANETTVAKRDTTTSGSNYPGIDTTANTFDRQGGANG